MLVANLANRLCKTAWKDKFGRLDYEQGTQYFSASVAKETAPHGWATSLFLILTTQ